MRLSGLAHAQNSGTIRATRPLDRGTVRLMMDDSRLRGNDMFMIDDLKAEGREVPTRGRSAKRTQFSASRTAGTGQLRQTNPIPAIMPIRRSAFPGGQSCQTNPIRRDLPRKTNPIPGRQGIPRIPLCCHSTIPARYQLRRTKPISPVGQGRGRLKRAKQTQFG
jgi:hypothetical protein